MFRVRAYLALVCLVVGGFAVAQTHRPATQTTAPDAKPKAAAPAAPTELERSQLENIQLRLALLEDEEQSLPTRRTDLVNHYGAIVRQIEAEHPGYAWNPQANALVPAPAKPTPPSKPAESENR